MKATNPFQIDLDYLVNTENGTVGNSCYLNKKPERYR